MNKKENPWKTLKKNTVYENPWIKVEHHEVLNPSGQPGVYGTVAFQNIAVGVIPIDTTNHTYLVGQFRFPLNAYSREIPEGGCQLNTDPLATAKRELKEEFSIDTEISKYLTESFYEYENININLRAYLVENFSGNFNLKDHDKIDWINIEDIKKYDFAPADIPINNYLIKHGL